MTVSDDDTLDAALLALAAAPEVDPGLDVGGRVGPFELLELIGQGGMGRVFRARDVEGGGEVALKLLSAAHQTHGGAARFEREARLLARVSHPNVVRVVGAGVHGRTPFLAMELVRGQTLRAVLARGAPPAERVRSYGLALADALGALHVEGVVHRDLKPENVMLDDAGTLKLLDFGLAKPVRLEGQPGTVATGTGVVLGTAGYMAPEQVRARHVDARADVFALGAVLYELCTGAPAFAGPSAIETMHAILSSRPERLGTLGALDRVVARCLEKDPAGRYGSAVEARDALRLAAARGEAGEVVAPPAGLPPSTRYAKNGDAYLAYQTAGDRGPDLLFVPGFVSQVEHWWEEAEGMHFFGSLAARARLIMFDKRGTGLSDRVPDERLPSLEERMSDIDAVLRAAGSPRAVLFGISEGGPLCLRFAAEHPDRVRALILYGSSAVFGTNDAMAFLLDCASHSWGTGKTLELFGPSRAADPRARRWAARWERLGASPGAARRILEMLATVDVRPFAPKVGVPTLVLHRRGDRAVPVQGARYLARQIPGARFVELDGDDHVPMMGDVDEVLAHVGAFLRGLAP